MWIIASKEGKLVNVLSTNGNIINVGLKSSRKQYAF